MTGIRMVAATVLLALVTFGCGGDTATTTHPDATPASVAELTPDQIFQKVTETYQSMETYQAKGTVTVDMDMRETRVNHQTEFSILLKKPNLYQITWTQEDMSMPGMSQSGAVWSDGTEPYLYMGSRNAYSKMGRDDTALGGAMGISGGAAHTIPSLFLSVFGKQPSSFSRLIDPKLEGIEKAQDEECYVVSGSSAVSKKETWWISKSKYLIIEYSRSLEPPEGGAAMPEVTEEELEKSMKALGQEVTEESKQRMRESMKTAMAKFKDAGMRGSSTEIHTNISSPKLAKEDFQFVVPEGTELKNSLLGGVLGDAEQWRRFHPAISDHAQSNSEGLFPAGRRSVAALATE